MQNELEKKLGHISPIFQNPQTGALDGSYFASTFGSKLTNLVYDVNTKVVYYYAKESNYIASPYISENGKYCRFIDGKIVEIN